MRRGDEEHRKRLASRCKHFSGMYPDTHCKAGVEYDSVRDRSQVPYRYPCLHSESTVICPKAEYPTPEEIDASIAQSDLTIKRINETRKRIVEATGGAKGVHGRLKCDYCEGEVLYSVSGYNGHIHANCTTSGCVCWME